MSPRRAVHEMARLPSAIGGRRNKLRLDFNENTVGASPQVLDFMKRFLTAARPRGVPRVRERAEDLRSISESAKTS